MNRVCVTGLGAVSPLGADFESSFAAAVDGRSAVRLVAGELARWLPKMLVAPARIEPAALLDPSDQNLDRAAQFGLAAAIQAMNAAGIVAPLKDGKRFGVYAGIGLGGAQTLDGMSGRLAKAFAAPEGQPAAPLLMHPLTVPRMMPNATAAAISLRYKLCGPSLTYSVACASSAIAIGEAFRAIRHGYIDAAVAVGAEAMLTLSALAAWQALRVIAKPDPQDVTTSCKPFAADRSGFVLGEGGAALVLESEDRAKARGAPILAEIAGFGCSSDATHITLPDAAGQAAAMQMALDDAGLQAQQIGYLNAHGTATEAGDIVECQSIRAVFGAAANQLAVSSTKSVHGHLIGAAGALELALCIKALQTGVLPPTAHLTQPDARCDLDLLPNVARRDVAIEAVMSNSFAFGGSNACLVARRMSNQ